MYEHQLFKNCKLNLFRGEAAVLINHALSLLLVAFLSVRVPPVVNFTCNFEKIKS